QMGERDRGDDVGSLCDWSTPADARCPGVGDTRSGHGRIRDRALLAGGPLQAHEEEQLMHIAGRAAGVSERQTLNAYFVNDAGLAELTERLRSGCYDITVPEEGALLVVAWLAGNGS